MSTQINNLENICNEFLKKRNKSSNDFYELELRFGNKGIRLNTRNDYDNIIKTLKSVGFTSKETGGNQSLKILTGTYSNDKKYFNTDKRVEIIGIGPIQQYCLSNKLDDVMKYTPNFVTKSNVKDGTVNFDDFNFKVVLAKEDKLSKSGIIELNKNWESKLKLFRYMNRVSFEKEGSPFRVDLSIVQSSTKNKNNKNQMTPYTNTDDANVFENIGAYEIEVEIVNAKISDKSTGESLAKSILSMAKTILIGFQRTPYPISYPDQRSIVTEYLTMITPNANELKRAKENEWYQIKPSMFIGPSPVTLQIVNIIDPLDKETIKNTTPNILNNYTVTDKADGERRMLYINDIGKIYFITISMNIIFTGMKATKKECFNSLLDGEYIMHDKHGKFYNVFGVFDVYFYQGKSVRKCPFMMTPARMKENDIKNTRYGLAGEIIKHLDIDYAFNNTKDKNNDSKLDDSKLKIKMKIFVPNYNKVTDKSSLNIFTSCNYILKEISTNRYEYKTDGIILTPVEFGVGGNNVKEEGPLSKGTWRRVFKWKPPEFNTIDFLVTTVKHNSTDYIHSCNPQPNGEIEQYKKIELQCGYNKDHSEIFLDPCKMVLTDDFPKLDDNKDKEHSYKPLRFYPTNPWDKMAGITNIMLTQTDSGNMSMLTEEKDIFEDLTIVEFKYDSSKEEGWRWIPIHVRYDKTSELKQGIPNYGNSFEVANDNWYSIHNPVTENMMTGKGIPTTYSSDNDVYYNTSNKSSKVNTERMRKFHNKFVKKILITSVTENKSGKTLLDFACGKAGDLYKWVDAKLSFVFGIDLEKDNIHNKVDGACARYVNERIYTNNKTPDAIFVVGNSGRHIRSTTESGAISNHDDAKITRAVLGLSKKSDNISDMSAVVRQKNSGKDGFDITSCQFAVHYMCKDVKTFHTFLRNVSECTKLNGYFIGTTYDGETIFKLLKSNKIHTGINKTESNILIWEIIKEYGDVEWKNDHASLGMAIKVFQDSINQYFTEYLVNFDYLNDMMDKYGFKLITSDEAKELNSNLSSGSSMFKDLYEKYETPKNKMRDYEKTISNLNRYFIFKKIRDVNAKDVSDTYINKVQDKPVTTVDDDIVKKTPTIITRTGKKVKMGKKIAQKAQKHKTAIIVPFRDTEDGSRGRQLDRFIEHMTKFMGDNAYTIYIMNQSDNSRKFNRGALLNVGYRLAIQDKDIDIFVFHDVDLLPNDALLPRYITPPIEGGVHISKMWERYGSSDIDSKHYFGGIVSFNKESYKSVNGYPNSFWGWGGEDDAIRDRMTSTNIPVEEGAPIEGLGKITDLEDLTLEEKLRVLKDQPKTKAQFKKERVKQDGVNFQWKQDGVEQVTWEKKDESIPDKLKQISDDHVQVNNVNVMPDVDTVESSIEFVADYKKDTLENIENEPRLLDADLSDIPTNFDNVKSCVDTEKTGKKIPFATNEETFYELVPDVLEFQRKTTQTTPLKSEMFNNLTSESIKNTFKYLFHKVRMGVFVYIKGGKLHRFVPFYNMNFENNWSDEIKDKFEASSGKIGKLDEYIKEKKNTLKKTKIDDYEKDITKWPTNNCMLGTWSGEEVGDLGWYETRDMFVNMCKENDVSDCVFFYNRRDHPVLTVNGMEPYFHIYNGLDTLLKSHKYSTYSPIVGYSKNDKFADILIPTYSDWANSTGKVYMSNCSKVDTSVLNTSWDTKKNVAMFRGSSTGCGSTPETNQRLGISVIMKNMINNNDKDTKENKNLGKHNDTDMFDVGLTGINTRDKKYSGENVKFIDPEEYTTVKKLTYEEQSNYKYIIHIDGHVSAFRLGKELSMGSCILKVDSLYDYELWFSDKMIAYDQYKNNADEAHYIRVDKDMTNLIEKVKWCRANDSVCQKIAQNALKLHEQIFTKDYMMKYCADIVNSIALGYSPEKLEKIIELEKPKEPSDKKTKKSDKKSKKTDNPKKSKKKPTLIIGEIIEK